MSHGIFVIQSKQCWLAASVRRPALNNLSRNGASLRANTEMHCGSDQVCACAAQLLRAPVGGPFAASGAEAPLSSQDARRQTACKSQRASARLVAASSLPLEPPARGGAAGDATNVRRTQTLVALQCSIVKHFGQILRWRPNSRSCFHITTAQRYYFIALSKAQFPPVNLSQLRECVVTVSECG
jgi:hypothetical protein